MILEDHYRLFGNGRCSAIGVSVTPVLLTTAMVVAAVIHDLF